MALIRSEPFRDLDRMLQAFYRMNGAPAPMQMPMDAYANEDRFVLEFDLPGVTADAIELTVEGDTLTVKAERPAHELPEGAKAVVTERPFGMFARQILLGERLDSSRIEAKYESGVLKLSIPVEERAKPRRIEVKEGEDAKQLSTVGNAG